MAMVSITMLVWMIIRIFHLLPARRARKRAASKICWISSMAKQMMPWGNWRLGPFKKTLKKVEFGKNMSENHRKNIPSTDHFLQNMAIWGDSAIISSNHMHYSIVKSKIVLALKQTKHGIYKSTRRWIAKKTWWFDSCSKDIWRKIPVEFEFLMHN